MSESDRKAFARDWIGAKALGAYMGRMLDPIARARGFATTTLLSQWPAVVGADLARFTMPDKVVWPRRRPEGPPKPQNARHEDGALLVLRVDGPRAIEVQHRADQILERVNTYFGYRAIVSLRILQAPVKRSVARSHVAEAVGDATQLPAKAAIRNDALRQALMRLQANVNLSAKRR